VSTKTGKFAVVYFPLDVKRMHLTKTVCYDLGNNKKKILNIPYTNIQICTIFTIMSKGDNPHSKKKPLGVYFNT
jgi:hypothetical protein